MLEEDAVTSDMLARLAGRLVEFHGKAETSQRIAEYGDWAIRYAWDENIEQWAPYVGETLSAKQDRMLSAYGEAFPARMAEALRRRVEEMRIRDCHGDLRSDAVCFEDGICIYDCIDFNRRLRYTDVAGDVGFLAMDLDYRGRPDLADEFVERYVEASGDGDLRAIIDYYKCYRACVRGKVEGFRTSQPEVPVSERRAAKRAARRYFALASRYAASMPPAVLVITCGLTGTGKSTLVRRLEEEGGFEVLSSDVLRKRLAGLESSEHRYEPFQRGIYAEAFTDRDSTYDALLADAGRALGAGRSVIVDASFVRRVYRKKAARLARESGAQFVCLLFEADDTIKRRLARRLREGRDASDGRMLVYRGQRRTFQRPSEVPEERLVALDSTKRVSSQLRVVRETIRRLSPLSWPG
jgi:predicted kinase